jgi:hypothetical protein
VFGVRCSVSKCNLLPAACCPPPAACPACCLLPARLLPAAGCPPPAARRLPPAARRLPPAACRLLPASCQPVAFAADEEVAEKAEPFVEMDEASFVFVEAEVKLSQGV